MMMQSRLIKSAFRSIGSSRWLSTRLVLGSHKHARIEPGVYPLIVQEAVGLGVHIIEAGQENGADSLAEALLGYTGEHRVTVLSRLGYNILEVANQDMPLMPADTVLVMKEQNESEADNMMSGDILKHITHSLSGAEVEKFLKRSPFSALEDENVETIPMLHNPEEHGLETISRLTDAFCALEEGVEKGQVPSFGVVSNGLSLPTDHPLHLDWKSVLQAACDAAKHTSKAKSSLSVMQLPVNALERRGLEVARSIHSYVKGGSTPHMPHSLEVYAMRPLTCYPDFGTGTGDGNFQLVDHLLPTEPGKMEWTHEMNQPPPVYSATYKTAVSYFDATEILEAKQERELTTDEKETLEGAKILLELIQDLDENIDKARSFAEHERELIATVTPILDGTFEAVDEKTMEVLQNYFGAMGIAVRYHISKKTRQVVEQGGEGVPPSSVPPEMTLQEHGIKLLLEEEAISKVLVGATKPEHVRDTLEIFKKY